MVSAMAASGISLKGVIMDNSKRTGILNIVRFHSAWKNTNCALAGVFAVIIIGVFPLVFRDYYFDILNCNYLCSRIPDGKWNLSEPVNLSWLCEESGQEPAV